MSYLDNDQDTVEREAQAFVKDYMRGHGKDHAAARKLLLGRVENRHDLKSKAIMKILKGGEA